MTAPGSFITRLFPPKPPGLRPLAARIIGFIFAVAGALLFAGGTFRQVVWTEFPAEITSLPAADEKSKGADVAFSVRLPDGRLVQSTESMVPSALKRLQAGQPLAARCRTSSDPKCETARAISDRIWLGLALLVTGLALTVIGRRQQRSLERQSNA